MTSCGKKNVNSLDDGYKTKLLCIILPKKWNIYENL